MYWTYRIVFNVCFKQTLEFDTLPEFKLKKKKCSGKEYMWNF